MGKYGTNLEGFGAFEGGVNADKGAPLVSTSSDGETSLLFGPAALREIQAGVANGDFAIPPDAAGDTITAENPLPYWTFTDVNSAGAITCKIENANSASSNMLTWTVAANTPTGKTATISRYVPVPSSRDTSYGSWLELYAALGSAHTDRKVIMTLQFYMSDFTAVGTAITRTFSFADFSAARTAVFLYGDNSDRLMINYLATFAKISFSIETTGTNVAQSQISFFEVKTLLSQPMLLLTPRSSGSGGPASIWKDADALYISADIPTTASAIGALSTTRPYIKLDGTEITNSSATTISGDLTVSGTTQLNGANSNWLARITATATQSLTNNTATKITFNTASATPTTDSYDPQTWFDNANDRIVIGQDGFYNITANIGFATNATGRRLVQIFVNGADRGSVQVAALSGATTLLSVSTNVYLVATDYVEVHALQQSGGALNTVSVTGVYPVLSVGRIGA
jgi:hypothetical protein